MAWKSLQSNIKTYDTDNSGYSLFLGGLNTSSPNLKQYTPLRTGYSRIFFVKMPYFMKHVGGAGQGEPITKRVKHIMEYGCTGVSGFGNLSLTFEQITGGYAGKSFDVATVAKDETDTITIKMYEFTGSPIREYMEMWITGIADVNTGLAHYHNAYDANGRVKYGQQNHVAEAFYVSTGPSGRADDIEYCCFLTNMMPKGATKDHFEYAAGEHRIVEISQEFTCVKYESPQINTIGKELINKYIIIRDYLDFKSNWYVSEKALKDDRGKNAVSGKDEYYSVDKLDADTITDWDSTSIKFSDYV